MEWLSKGFDKGAYSPNDIREKMGDELIDEPAMNARYISANMMPIGEGEIDEEAKIMESNQFYQEQNINEKI